MHANRVWSGALCDIDGVICQSLDERCTRVGCLALLSCSQHGRDPQHALEAVVSKNFPTYKFSNNCVAGAQNLENHTAARMQSSSRKALFRVVSRLTTGQMLSSSTCAAVFALARRCRDHWATRAVPKKGTVAWLAAKSK